MKIKVSWTEAIDGFPDVWDGICGGTDVLDPRSTRVSALLGPDGEPLVIERARMRLGFDLTPRGKP